MAEALAPASGVVCGITARGFGFLSAASEMEVEVIVRDTAAMTLARRIAALRAFVGGRVESLRALLGASEQEGRELLSRVRSAGFLAATAARPAASSAGGCGVPLVEAIVGTGEPRVAWTAEEALVLPAHVDATRRRRILRAFVAGFDAPLRLELYATAALAAEATVLGDQPSPEDVARVARALPALDPERAHVLSFASGRWESLAPHDVLAPDPAPGRLRIVSPQRPAVGPAGAGLHLAAVRYACPDLAFARQHATRLAYGAASDPAQAQAVAAAEAVERYACGDAAAHRLRRAAAVDVDGAIPADSLLAYAPEHYERDPSLRRFDPKTPILWIEGRTWTGARRHVPAEFVLSPFHDPHHPTTLGHATSSGAAAASSWTVAARRGALEVVERDSFMWHWIQRVGRETIAPASLPRELRTRVAVIEDGGPRVRLVNLTLDTKPVVLCALLAADGHGLGLAAADDPAAAAAHALSEAQATFVRDRDARLIDPRLVRFPHEHRDAYAAPERRERASFLWSGSDTLGLGELSHAREPVERVVAPIGEPVFVTLTPRAAGTLTVVKALIPRMLPMAFGYGAEPCGMERAQQPITGCDGRRRGARRELHERGPDMPHPFA